jgi:hypothetical protein
MSLGDIIDLELMRFGYKDKRYRASEVYQQPAHYSK